MSVSGFSVLHDAEYQQYRALRKIYLAQQERQRAAEHTSNPSQHTTSQSKSFFKRMFRNGGKQHEYERRSVSVGGNVVSSKKLDEDSDFEDEGDEVKGFTLEHRVRSQLREQSEKKVARVRVAEYA